MTTLSTAKASLEASGFNVAVEELESGYSEISAYKNGFCAMFEENLDWPLGVECFKKESVLVDYAEKSIQILANEFKGK